jgi:hypothetical protein
MQGGFAEVYMQLAALHAAVPIDMAADEPMIAVLRTLWTSDLNGRSSKIPREGSPGAADLRFEILGGAQAQFNALSPDLRGNETLKSMFGVEQQNTEAIRCGGAVPMMKMGSDFSC